MSKKVKILKRISPPGFTYVELAGNKPVVKHEILRVGDVIEISEDWGADAGLEAGEYYARITSGGKDAIAAPVSDNERVTAYPLNGEFSDGPSRSKKQNSSPAKADKDDKHPNG